MFTSVRAFPGITHITDAMGVSFTLIEGAQYAILYDTGYGTEDAAAYVKSLTDKPMKVFLSHGHHDHVLGARWFSESYLCEEDLAEFCERTGKLQREKVKKQAETKNVPVPADYLESSIPAPKTIRFTDTADGFQCLTENPGGITVRVMRIPGHTPGSIVIFIPEYGLLLTGDDWNPCTWMWFPSSLPATVWRENMMRMIHLTEKDGNNEIRHILCSHQPAMRNGDELKNSLAYMTDERISSAPTVNMGAPINTCMIRNEAEDWTLIFDRDKI